MTWNGPGPPPARGRSPAGQLREAGWLAESDEVVVLSTGCGLKYPETMPASLPLLADGIRIRSRHFRT